jgi:hypothetical protein
MAKTQVATLRKIAPKICRVNVRRTVGNVFAATSWKQSRLSIPVHCVRSISASVLPIDWRPVFPLF